MTTHYYRTASRPTPQPVLIAGNGPTCASAPLDLFASTHSGVRPGAKKKHGALKKTLTYVILMVLWVLCLVVGSVDAAVIVSKERIQEAVREFVLEELGGFDARMEVEVRSQRDLRVEGAGAVDLVVRSTGRQSHSRSIPLKLELYRGPAVVEDHRIVAHIRYFDRVAVATHPLERGQSLGDSDLRIENREVTNLLEGYVRDLDSLRGFRTKTRIGVGRVLQKRFIERIPLVERREKVRIDVRVGTIRASVTGIAKESGALGDQIVVQNTDSREKIIAEVVGPGMVRVVLPH